jgi:hypothetical protein
VDALVPPKLTTGTSLAPRGKLVFTTGILGKDIIHLLSFGIFAFFFLIGRSIVLCLHGREMKDNLLKYTGIQNK